VSLLWLLKQGRSRDARNYAHSAAPVNFAGGETMSLVLLEVIRARYGLRAD